MTHDADRSSPRRFIIMCSLFASTTLAGAALAQADPQLEPAAQPAIVGCGKAQALQQKYIREQMREDWKAEYDRMLAAGLREALTDTDVLHCDLEIEILPDQYDNMIGTNTLTIQSRSNSLSQFTFRLRSQYNVTSILINGSTPVTFSTPSTTTRVVTLDRTYAMDEVFTLTIAYSGHAESRGFGSIEFTTHNTEDIVYTLSESYFAYTWWPCKDGDFGEPGDNGDKFTLDLGVIAPDTMVTASNGTLQGVDTLSGNRLRYRWSTNYPISTYLVCFSATNYNTWTEYYTPSAGRSMPVDFYIYPESDTPSNRAAWGKAVDMLYVLRDIYGEYPFITEKYGIYECQFGGGMEHQTFTAQGTFSESVTVHELGHQWWGDMITCNTWNHIWINEGFAAYTEALWAERKPGSSGLPALKSVMATKKYTGAGSVYVTDAEVANMNAIFDTSTTYNKAAWVLHMLRHVLGDDNFFDALAAYRAAFQYSAASTEDFQGACEPFYPTGDLSWFFSEWIYGERTPAYQWGWTNAQIHGQNYLLLSIDQTQDAAYQRFTMPIDIVVNGDTYTAFDDHDPQNFVIPLPAPATTVDLDPDEWILTSGRTTAAYSPGPPKIVETYPDPGQIVEMASAPDQVDITFHTPVNASAADFSLVGAAGGAQSVTYTYSASDNKVTLTAAAPLPPDIYTLTISDALTAVNSGQQLDGEITDAQSLTSLPSGNGVAGGSAAIQFAVICAFGDADCDGDIDLADFASFQSCYTGPDAGPAAAGCEPMRFDADTDVDTADLADFVDTLTGP